MARLKTRGGGSLLKTWHFCGLLLANVLNRLDDCDTLKIREYESTDNLDRR